MGPIAGELTIERSDTRNEKQQHFPSRDGKEDLLVEFQAGSPLHRRLPITYNSEKPAPATDFELRDHGSVKKPQNSAEQLERANARIEQLTDEVTRLREEGRHREDDKWYFLRPSYRRRVTLRRHPNMAGSISMAVAFTAAVIGLIWKFVGKSALTEESSSPDGAEPQITAHMGA